MITPLVFAALTGSLIQQGPFPFHPALPNPHPRVLVFSKTAAFRHDSIPTGVAMFRELGQANGFSVEATEDAGVFDADLAGRFDTVVFLSTTGDVLNSSQQRTLESFVEQGGGYVGIHAASDTEYGWPWYGRLVGAYFKRHPQIQPAKIRIEDRRHPTMTTLPDPWDRTDEWYDFRANPRPFVHVLASLDPASYSGSDMKNDHPATWYQFVGKGRAWYTAFGHTKESYGEPEFRNMLLQAVIWSSQARKPDGAVTLQWNRSGETLTPTTMLSDGLIHLEFFATPDSPVTVRLNEQYWLRFGGVQDGMLGSGRWRTKPLREALIGKSWNSLDLVVRIPRFTPGKPEAGILVEARLNGIVIHSGAKVGSTGYDLKIDLGPNAFVRDAYYKRLVMDWVN